MAEKEITNPLSNVLECIKTTEETLMKKKVELRDGKKINYLGLQAKYVFLFKWRPLSLRELPPY